MPAFIGAMFGVGAVIFLPIFYGVMGFIGGLIGALIYNVVAGMIGGVELDVTAERRRPRGRATAPARSAAPPAAH